MPADGALLREQAVAAALNGDAAQAAALFDRAVAAAPADASILNSAAAHWSKLGDKARAVDLLERAVAADPSASEPLLNLAILLTANGNPARAIDLLAAREAQLAGIAKYWSIRASAERAAGLKRAAYASYERAAELDPSNPRASEGRARMALETGLGAREAYRSALRVAPGAPTVVLGFSLALEAAGDRAEARTLAEHLVEQLPGWTDGLEWLAQLRWAAGEREDFASHYAGAAERSRSPEVYQSWCRMLAGADRFGEAAEAAARAQAALGDSDYFALLEAIHAGEAGDGARAEAIFHSLRLETAERNIHEARHRLRTGSPERAEQLTASVIAEAPDSIAAWALRDIAWRLLGDPRHEWLHCLPGLVEPMQLGFDEDQLAAIVAFLDRLHDVSVMPVGQSVREGSQTRGGLFDRHEPEVRLLEEGFRKAVEEYRAQLPPFEPAHPLLRHRDASWRFEGSWSIRVFSGGRHTEHIHPKGLVSSAAYFVVPPAGGSDPHAGWLELGRPPPDLRLDLPPLYTIEPVPGQCALFPSTLYHGTRTFPAGKRMTVAIDIHTDRAG